VALRPEHRDELVHDAAARADVPLCTAAGVGQRRAAQREVIQFGECRAGYHGQGRRGRQPCSARHAQRRGTIQQAIEPAQIRSLLLSEQLRGALRIVGPVSERLRWYGRRDCERAWREVRLDVLQADQAVSPRPRDQQHVPVQRHRHHIAPVVVGMLTDQVHAARRMVHAHLPGATATGELLERPPVARLLRGQQTAIGAIHASQVIP